MSIDNPATARGSSSMIIIMAYNYVAISYSGQTVRLYYIDKNDDKREISFYDMDSFERTESKLRRISYLTLIGNQTIYIEDPTKLVAELVSTNHGPFLLFDDYNFQRRFASDSKVEFHHHSQFIVLYHADEFNRAGVLRVLKSHSFTPIASDLSHHPTFGSMKNWLRRKCSHIFSMCLEEGECDPDCYHHKYT
jgi:hypothetical protein